MELLELVIENDDGTNTCPTKQLIENEWNPLSSGSIFIIPLYKEKDSQT